MKADHARILLTGATGGIGGPAAAAFLRAGASVMLVGRNAANLAAQAQKLLAQTGAAPAQLTYQLADLANPASINTLAEAAAAWRCNVLVHGAGVPSFGRLESLAAQDMLSVLQTNLLAPMLLTQQLLPHLRSLPKAQVICVGSALGRIGLPGYSAYSASKFGLRGFAEAMRRELLGSSVQMQYFGPRSTQTEFNSAEVQAYNQATGTAVDAPELVAQALLALLEDEAAERFLGFPEKLAVRINGLVPTWLDSSFKQHSGKLSPVGTPKTGRVSPSTF